MKPREYLPRRVFFVFLFKKPLDETLQLGQVSAKPAKPSMSKRTIQPRNDRRAVISWIFPATSADGFFSVHSGLNKK